MQQIGFGCENLIERFPPLLLTPTNRPQTGQGADMSRNNMMLLESIRGHLELLAAKHPKKAASPVARRVKRYLNKARKNSQD